MLHLYAIDIHGVAQQYELELFLALSDSTPDSSTTRGPIPILSTGHCPAASQLHNGVRYVPVRWIFMIGRSLCRLGLTIDPATTRYTIPILSTGQCQAPSQLSNGICYISTR